MDLQRYGVKGLPTTILFDRTGLVREKAVGLEYTSVIERDLRELIEAKIATEDSAEIRKSTVKLDSTSTAQALWVAKIESNQLL